MVRVVWAEESCAHQLASVQVSLLLYFWSSMSTTPSSVPKYKSLQRSHYEPHTDVYRCILECRFTHFAPCVVHSGISTKDLYLGTERVRNVGVHFVPLPCDLVQTTDRSSVRSTCLALMQLITVENGTGNIIISFTSCNRRVRVLLIKCWLVTVSQVLINNSHTTGRATSLLLGNQHT